MEPEAAIQSAQNDSHVYRYSVSLSDALRPAPSMLVTRPLKRVYHVYCRPKRTLAYGCAHESDLPNGVQISSAMPPWVFGLPSLPYSARSLLPLLTNPPRTAPQVFRYQ